MLIKNVKAIQHHVLELAADEEAWQIENSLWWLLGRKTIIRNFLHRVDLKDLFFFVRIELM